MCCTSVLVIALASALADKVPDLDMTQQSALEARRSVRSGEIVYELLDGIPNEQRDLAPDWKVRLRDRLVFDTQQGWHAFLERWHPEEPVLLKDGKPLVQRTPNGGHVERIVVNPEQCFQYSPDQLSDGTGFGITADISKRNPIELAKVMHPWKWGLIPENFGVQHQYPADELGVYVSPTVQLSRTIVEDLLDGDKTWRIAFMRSDGRQVTTWVDPARGMNVRKVVEQGMTKHGPFVVSAVSTLKHYPEANVWFPERVLFMGMTNGDRQKASHEQIVITEAAFNMTIDPAKFSIKGLMATPHTSIAPRDPQKGVREEWNGEKVAPLHPRAELAVKKEVHRRSLRQLLLISGAVLSLVVSLFWLTFKKRA